MVYPQKIEVVKGWFRPSSMTEVRSFICLASYYLGFVMKVASISTHLTRLAQKKVLFI